MRKSTSRAWTANLLFLCGSLTSAVAGEFVEPWQLWSQRPVESPLLLQASVRAETGTEVYVNVAGNTYTNVGEGLYVDSVTNTFIPQVEPHEPYVLSVSGSGVASVRLKLDGYVPRQILPKHGPGSVPKPYRVFLGGQWQTNLVEISFASPGNNSTNLIVEVRPDRGFRPASLLKLEDQWSREEDPAQAMAAGDGVWPQIGPGRDTVPGVGAFRWAVSLGRMWNGQACGLVRLNEEVIASRAFTAAPLCYTARSTNTAELMVITNTSGHLRQIRAPQTLVDIQATNQPSEQCVLRFYLLSQAGTTTNASGLFTINDNNPFVTWRIKNPGAAGSTNRVQIIEERPGRTYTSEIEYSNQVWSLKTGSGAELRTETRTVSINGPVRTETVQIQSPTNTVYKGIETYKRFDWGWELTNVVSNPDGSGLTNGFAYYESASEPYAYRKLKDHWYPGGRWERMYYVAGWEANPCPSWPFGDSATYFPSSRYYEVKIRPWKDGPASLESATLTNVVQEITEYTGIDNGCHSSWYHDEFLGPIDDDRSLISMSDGVDGGDLYGQGLREERADGAGGWGTWKDVLIYDCPGHYLHDLLHNVTLVDDRADYYEYWKGTFDWGSQEFIENVTNGVDFCSQVTHGSRTVFGFADGCYTGCYYGDPSGPSGAPRVHLGKATQEIAVYQHGNTVFKQLLALQAIDPGGWLDSGQPVFTPFEQHVLMYDTLGHLTNDVWMDAVNTNVTRTVYQASWTGANRRDCELKAWEINETGETFNYTYDTLKRLSAVTRLGVSASGAFPSQSAITTNLVYDAVGRVKTVRVTAGAPSYSGALVYDLAGRLTAASGFDGVTTNFSYSADTRVTTETRPGGLTVVRSSYLDGRPKSLTGTAVVNEFYDYSVTDEQWQYSYYPDYYNYPKNVTRTTYASQTSERWREQLANPGRVPVSERFPGYGAGAETDPLEVFYSTTRGLVLSMSVPATMNGDQIVDYTETYTHNGYGDVIKTVAGSGYRESGQDFLLENDGTNWFRTGYQTTLLDWGRVTNGIRQRLSGYTSSSVLGETTLTDPDTNLTEVAVYLNRSAKQVTVVTNTARSTLNITNVTINGLLQTASTESVAAPTWFHYDSLGRLTGMTDGLGFSRSTAYDATTGWITSTTDPAGNTTSYQYYLAHQANAGRLKCQTGPTGKKAWHAYTDRGEPRYSWGDVPYPAERCYSSFGELTELRTFQGGTAWSTATSWPGAGVTAQSTVWNFDPATGLLLSKLDAAGRGYTNDYLLTRTLWTRTWARGVRVTNTFNDYGELLRKDYSDGTPSVVFDSLNLGGQPTSITDALGTSTLSYDFAGRLIGAAWWDSGSPFYGLAVNNRYHATFGRDQVKLDSWGTPLLVHDYGFDAGTGRLNLVSNGVFTATYAYKPNSDLLQSTTCKSNSTTVLTTTRSWEYGMRLGAIVNEVDGVNVSSHAYQYDAINRRTRAALEDGSVWIYEYNDRDELTGARRCWPDWTPVAGQQFGYTFDNIGNRVSARTGGDVNGAGLRETVYSANVLNQYTSVTTPGYRDILGVAIATNGVTVNGEIADRKVEYFHREITVANSSGPVWQNVEVVSAAATNGGGFVSPKNQQALTYDLDGNLSFDGVWVYEWDGENRLRAMTMTNVSGIPNAQRKRLEFAYDFMSRRAAKTVKTWTGSSFGNAVSNRFIYDLPAGNGGGWNVIAVLGSQSSVLQSFLWGQDLSGTMAGAGGVGGLLAVSDVSATINSPATHFAAYDGNGNIVGLIHAGNKSTTARYEYSPFGELLRLTGPMAEANPFRFSTKFWDDETGLVYYGYRYFSPGLGRWINRDPLEESGGGVQPYEFLNNRTTDFFDTDGRSMNQILPALTAVLAGANIIASELAHGNWSAAWQTTYEVSKSVDELFKGGLKPPPPPTTGAVWPPAANPRPTRGGVGDWVERTVRRGAHPSRGFPGAGLAVGGIFLAGSTGMANAANDLSRTFADYARHLQSGETTWADLDAATFAAQLSGGGADYFFTMGTLSLLMTIGDYAAAQSGCP